MADKFKCKYRCGWCGFVFEQIVGTGQCGEKQKVSSQVQCKQCNNFIPTFDGVLDIEEIKTKGGE